MQKGTTCTVYIPKNSFSYIGCSCSGNFFRRWQEVDKNISGFSKQAGQVIVYLKAKKITSNCAAEKGYKTEI